MPDPVQPQSVEVWCMVGSSGYPWPHTAMITADPIVDSENKYRGHWPEYADMFRRGALTVHRYRLTPIEGEDE